MIINDVSISVNCWPLSAKLASFMTRPIIDWFSELVFFKSQIGPGRKRELNGFSPVVPKVGGAALLGAVKQKWAIGDPVNNYFLLAY